MEITQIPFSPLHPGSAPPGGNRSRAPGPAGAAGRAAGSKGSAKGRGGAWRREDGEDGDGGYGGAAAPGRGLEVASAGSRSQGPNHP